VWCSRMRQKLSLMMTLVAWLLATGSHWDMVQTAAWGKMFASYSRSMSYWDALKMTFSVEGLCNVCEFVDDVKSDADGQPAPAEAGTRKVVLALAAVPRVVFAGPPAPAWPQDEWRLPVADRLAPPVPPPRA